MRIVKIKLKSLDFPVLEKSYCAVGKWAQNLILNLAKLFRSWIAPGMSLRFHIAG